jgi:hypothetical protein
MNRSIGSLRVVIPSLVLALGASNCLGAFFTGFGRLPTPDVPYELVNPPVAAGSVTIHSFQVQAANFADVEYPTIDFANNVWLLDSMFPVNWQMQLSIGLGPVFPTFGEGQMHVVGSAPVVPNPSTRVFQLELTQLDLFPSAVADPLIPVFVRESPTQASTGVTNVVDLCLACGAIHLQVDSFFDVFAEISLDGGQNWTPTAGPMHIVQLPEPGTLGLLLCSLPSALRGRRRS